MQDLFCRFCSAKLHRTFVNLGMSPLSNAYLTCQQLEQMEPFYPLHVRICERCFLVQLAEFETPEKIFSDYAYFSSCSESWLQHARRYAEQMQDRLSLTRDSLVVELASNDGYLLQFFQAKQIPVLGVEPAANVARAAREKGIPTVAQFFGTGTARQLAAEGKRADLIVANNVLAHVPDLNDFVAGMTTLLKPNGVITVEFPHLMRLIERNQFDTIYHEHFSYFSFHAAEQVFRSHSLAVFDVEELPTHGGSLRLYASHAGGSQPVNSRVEAMREWEQARGVCDLGVYASFVEKVEETKRKLLTFLIEAKQCRKHVAGYGAPAKANTLLNYCRIGTDLLDYTVDISPYKQGRYLPGTHIPIYHPDKLRETRPDFVLILPWNIQEEILTQMACVRDWGGRFVVPIPRLEVME
jgi:SAM-dependent methyltransferase